MKQNLSNTQFHKKKRAKKDKKMKNRTMKPNILQTLYNIKLKDQAPEKIIHGTI